MAIGYACIPLGFSNGTMRGCTLKKASHERLNQIIAINLDTLGRVLDYNASKHIGLFRISSDVIPLGSHPANQNQWWLDHAPTLHLLGEKIRQYHTRVSMHPGQYTVLNAKDQDIVDRAVADLEYHGRFLDGLGLDNRHKIILHVGGRYDDADSSLARFAANFTLLPETVKRRLALENDEKFNIAQVLELAKQLGIPAVFDVFHHQCFPPAGEHDDFHWLAECSCTWNAADGNQKIHYSQQEPGLRPGAHSHTIELKPFMDFYLKVPPQPLDIMLEVKDKDLSAMKCIYALEPDIPRRLIEEQWAHYKYLVMERSHNHYQTMGKLLNPRQPLDVPQFYFSLEEALNNTIKPGQAWNAAQHVWGYFKDVASDKERAYWQEKAVQYQQGQIDRSQLKAFLRKLARIYERHYLLASYYFVLD